MKISTYPAGKARRAFVESLAALYNLSVSTIYRWYREVCPGQKEERKVRADKGKRLLSEQDTERLGSLIFATKRQSKKILMSAKTAQEIASDNNFDLPDVSISTINRRLREIKMSKAQMKAPSPHIRLLTDHPNQLWEFDVSNCIQYFLEEKKGLQERDVEMELYKNKLENIKAIRQELLRYVIVDHCSGAFYLEYFYTSGEKSINAAEFFLKSFQQKKDERYRYHGVPFHLYIDKGSAVKADMIQGLLSRLSINCIAHLPGNPRAKGLVEGLHDYIERNFESRLIFHKPGSLIQMNDWAFDWSVKTNALEIFRETAPRSQLWSKISRDQLRLCPPEDVYRHLLRAKPETRIVKNDLRLSYEGKTYIVPEVNLKGEEVMVSYSPYEYPKILVTHEWLEHSLCLSPCGEADEYGRVTEGAVKFEVDADGKLNYKRLKDTETQKRLKAAEDHLADLGLTMKGTGDKRRAMAPATGTEKLVVFGHQADKVGNVAFIDKPGRDLPIVKSVEIRDYPYMKAIKIICERIGRGLAVAESEWIQKEHGSTISENDIDSLVDRLQAGQPIQSGQAGEAGGLRVVGGGTGGGER